MRKLNLQTQILQVLQDNAKNGGSGMSISEIKIAIYGDGYIGIKCPPSLREKIQDTTSELEKSIRNRMCAVVELAALNGITVFAQRKSCNPKTPEIKSRIALWKIFDPNILGMNEAFTDELMYKKKNGEAHTRTFKRMLKTAKEQSAIAPEKLKELESHQQ